MKGSAYPPPPGRLDEPAGFDTRGRETGSSEVGAHQKKERLIGDSRSSLSPLVTTHPRPGGGGVGRSVAREEIGFMPAAFVTNSTECAAESQAGAATGPGTGNPPKVSS